MHRHQQLWIVTDTGSSKEEPTDQLVLVFVCLCHVVIMVSLLLRIDHRPVSTRNAYSPPPQAPLEWLSMCW